MVLKQIRVHGRGGQGAVTCAELLATAAFDDGKECQAFPFFGVERRGAPVTAFCRISDAAILRRICRCDHKRESRRKGNRTAAVETNAACFRIGRAQTRGSQHTTSVAANLRRQGLAKARKQPAGDELNGRVLFNEQTRDHSIAAPARQHAVAGKRQLNALADAANPNADAGFLWITVQMHPNITGVASVKELSGILLSNDRQPLPDTLEKAQQEHIPLLGSRLSTYELAMRIGRLLAGDKGHEAAKS